MSKILAALVFIQLSIYCATQTVSVLQGALITPPPREDSISQLIAPYVDWNNCGNTLTQDVLYITSVDIVNRFQWTIFQEAGVGTCTFYLQLSDSDQFVPLMPTNINTTNGSFPCGSTLNAVEYAKFIFTRDQICNNCVIRWAWENEYGVLNQCADVQILEVISDPGCQGLCQNGGVCNQDSQVCECLPGYYGNYCQLIKTPIQKSHKKLIIILVIIILTLICGAVMLYMFAQMKNKKDRASMVFAYGDHEAAWTQMEPRKSHVERPSSNIRNSKQLSDDHLHSEHQHSEHAHEHRHEHNQKKKQLEYT